MLLKPLNVETFSPNYYRSSGRGIPSELCSGFQPVAQVYSALAPYDREIRSGVLGFTAHPKTLSSLVGRCAGAAAIGCPEPYRDQRLGTG
jgi:hypothetical protein